MPGVSISTTMSGWKLLKPVVWTRISIPTENGLWTRSCPGISWTAVYPEPFWKAKNETISPNCKQACQGCGAARFGCGICVEPRG